VTDIIVALGTSSEGIPFESVDESPARLVILLVIPKGSLQQHVRTLAGVSAFGTRPELRERALAATSAQEIMDAIHELEGRERYRRGFEASRGAKTESNKSINGRERHVVDAASASAYAPAGAGIRVSYKYPWQYPS